MDLRSGFPEPSAAPAPDALSWRVSRSLAWGKAAATAAFVLIALLPWTDRTEMFAALVGAAVIGAYAARDFIAPVRLSADPDGVTVLTGYAGRRRLAWSEIEQVRVDQRTRLGLRSETLEIDTGETLYLFSTYDLNAPVAEVEEALQRLSTGK